MEASMPVLEKPDLKGKNTDEEALRLHSLYQGKIQVIPKCPIRNSGDFAYWYTPGVAAPCRAIQADPPRVYEFTNKANLIAIVSDGSRVLGLGNIGPHAGLPVMESKALLFKYLGGVDAIAICLATQEEREIVRTVQLLEPSFGGINLEDIPATVLPYSGGVAPNHDHSGLARRSTGFGDGRSGGVPQCVESDGQGNALR
jgi:malate dehydrogenase (oxaloacetate-decarboxylating)